MENQEQVASQEKEKELSPQQIEDRKREDLFKSSIETVTQNLKSNMFSFKKEPDGAPQEFLDGLKKTSEENKSDDAIQYEQNKPMEDTKVAVPSENKQIETIEEDLFDQKQQYPQKKTKTQRIGQLTKELSQVKKLLAEETYLRCQSEADLAAERENRILYALQDAKERAILAKNNEDHEKEIEALQDLAFFNQELGKTKDEQAYIDRKINEEKRNYHQLMDEIKEINQPEVDPQVEMWTHNFQDWVKNNEWYLRSDRLKQIADNYMLSKEDRYHLTGNSKGVVHPSFFNDIKQYVMQEAGITHQQRPNGAASQPQQQQNQYQPQQPKNAYYPNQTRSLQERRDNQSFNAPTHQLNTSSRVGTDDLPILTNEQKMFSKMIPKYHKDGKLWSDADYELNYRQNLKYKFPEDIDRRLNPNWDRMAR